MRYIAQIGGCTENNLGEAGMNESSINAILGPGSNHRGTLVLKGRVLIEGHLAGSVFSDELIEVAQGALVEGGVSAPQVLVGGVIT